MLIVLSKFVHTGRGRAESISLYVHPKDSSRTTAHTTTLLQFESALMFFRWYVIAKYFPLCNFLSSFFVCACLHENWDWTDRADSAHTSMISSFNDVASVPRKLSCVIFLTFRLLPTADEELSKKKAKKPFNDNVRNVYNFGLSPLPLSGCELSKWRKRPRMWKISKKNSHYLREAWEWWRQWLYESWRVEGSKFYTIKVLHTHEVNKSKNR